MRALLLTLAIFAGLVPALATEHNIAQAETDAANVKTLVLNGSNKESARLLKLAPKLTSLETVIIDGITDDEAAKNLVSSVAACNKVRTINFRNCVLNALPSNLRMLTQVKSFESENTTVTDGEQFYNAIGDMPNVENVTVTGNDFRSLPKSFSRMRVMNNINLVNNDLQLASGYDLNTRTPDELRSTETVQFGFGDEALNLNYTCYNAEAGKSHVQMFRDVLQGAYRESNVFYTPLEGKVFRKDHPLVKAPVKGMDIYPDVYSVNAMTGSVVEYGSGTRISVPAMAFEDANGTPVQGNVDISYREFRDPIDIVLSGIPMKYDSGGVVGDFKSAGMFEMEASQNGSEVFLRQGKNVDLKFAVTDTASNYNFYRLDEKKGWTYLSAPGVTEADAPNADLSVATTRRPDVILQDGQQTQLVLDSTGAIAGTSQVSTISAASFALNLYWQSIVNVRVKDWIKDTTAFDRRYEDTCYFGTTRQFFQNTDKAWSQKRKASSRLYFRKRASGKDYTVISIGQVNAMYGLNPELSAYNGYYWKLDGKMTSKQVSSRFGRKSGINDCRVVQEGSDYYLELKYHWGFDKIKAEPVKLDDKKRPISLKDEKKERLFTQYTKRLNGRRSSMAKNNAQQVRQQETRVQRAHNDSVRVWKGLRKQMEPDEKAMDFPAWREYAKQQRVKLFAATLNADQNAQSAAYQALSISGMGIYNCDQVARMQKPKDFVAHTVAAAGAVIVPAMIYVIDKVRNMVFTYYGDGIGGVHGTYDDNSKMQMLATDKDGNLYQTNEDQFDAGKVTGVSRLEFEGQQISGPNTTPETVRQAVFGAEPK